MRTATVLLLIVSACATSDAERKDHRQRDWTLVFHLPYDNDLDRHGGPILDELERGTLESEEVAVVALVDWRGAGGMSRHLIVDGEQHRQRLESDRSADAASVRELLTWARRHAPAKRYAVFMLGHGGGGDVSSYDGWVDEPDAPQWLTAGDLAASIGEGLGDERPDLLFLQQCGRGTLEALRQLDGVADVVIASQAVVGAPNSYYRSMLEALAANTDVDGERLARHIIDGESDDMFIEYTAWDGDALGDVARLSDAARVPVADVPLEEGTDLRLTYAFGGRNWVNLVDLERIRYGNAELDTAALDALEQKLTHEARLFRRVSDSAPRAVHDWHGLSVPLPAEPAVLDEDDFPGLVIIGGVRP